MPAKCAVELLTVTNKSKFFKILIRLSKSLIFWTVFEYDFKRLEAEEPKMAIPSDDTPEEEKNDYYTQLAAEKVMKMIEKANEKNPDGATLSPDVWSKLPTTLKYKISAKIMGTDTDVNF